MNGAAGETETFQLQLPGFEGPVEALVREMEAGHMRVDDLPLAEVSAQFISWTREVGGIDLPTTGEFLRQASRLAVLKSSQLLAEPADDEEVDDSLHPRAASEELDGIREVALLIGARHGMEAVPAAAMGHTVDRVVEPRPASALPAVWEGMLKRRGRALRVVVPLFVRVESAINGILHRIRSGVAFSFQRELRGASRTDAIVHFLGVLELVRRRRIEVHQASFDDDILVTSRAEDGTEADTRAG